MLLVPAAAYDCAGRVCPSVRHGRRRYEQCRDLVTRPCRQVKKMWKSASFDYARPPNRNPFPKEPKAQHVDRQLRTAHNLNSSLRPLPRVPTNHQAVANNHKEGGGARSSCAYNCTLQVTRGGAEPKVCDVPRPSASAKGQEHSMYRTVSTHH
jgi:hypothetical protein